PVLSCGSADEQSRNVLNSLVCVQPSARRWRHLLNYCIRGSRFYTDRVLLFLLLSLFLSLSLSLSLSPHLSPSLPLFLSLSLSLSLAATPLTPSEREGGKSAPT